MRKQFVILVTVLLTTSVFLPQQASAQSPEKMSYQAVIRDVNDVLITNTQVSIQISILQGSASGTAVYVETQEPTSNTNGLISIEIGGITAIVISGDFATINWANGPYFIKTETDPSGGTNYTITGTSQLLSVPYALHSKTAETITGTITETDPVYTAWDKDYEDLTNTPTIPVVPDNVSDFNNDVEYLTEYNETDPLFNNWDKSSGISISETQITDLQAYLTAESDGDSSNELQVLTISNDTLYLSNGGFAKLPEGFSGDYDDLTNKPEIDNTITDLLEILKMNGVNFVDSWIGSRSVAVDSIIYFRDTSNMNAISWNWDFGDGTSSTNQHPSHIYTTAGTYTVTQTVSNGITNFSDVKNGYIVAHDIVAGSGVTDIDGNVYSSIIIDSQEWMASNLAVTTFPDGTPIVNDIGWSNVENTNTSFYYCWYNDDISTKDTYGAFYTFATAVYGTPSSGGPDNIQGVCPDGWHLPSQTDWNTLLNYLRANDYNYNLDTYNYKEAKSFATKDNWYSSPMVILDEDDAGFDPKSNNSSGFSGMPLGYRSTNSSFNYHSKNGYWWTTAEGTSATYANCIGLYYNSSYVNSAYNQKGIGINVRCVKN